MSFFDVDNTTAIQHRGGNLLFGNDAGVPVPPSNYTTNYVVNVPFPIAGNPYSTLDEALDAAVARGVAGASIIGVYAAGTTYLGFYTQSNFLPSYFVGGATLDDDPPEISLIFGPRALDNVINDPGTNVCGYLFSNGIQPEPIQANATLRAMPNISYPLIGLCAFVFTWQTSPVDLSFTITLNNCIQYPNVPDGFFPAVPAAPLTIITVSKNP